MLILITIKLKILFILKHLLSVIYIHDGTFDKDKKPKLIMKLNMLVKSVKMMIIL